MTVLGVLSKILCFQNYGQWLCEHSVCDIWKEATTENEKLLREIRLTKI
jgi:hypothetical protein